MVGVHIKPPHPILISDLCDLNVRERHVGGWLEDNYSKRDGASLIINRTDINISGKFLFILFETHTNIVMSELV